MTKHDVAIWDVGEAVRMASERLSIEELAGEVIQNIPSELRSIFLIEANNYLIRTIIK